ncbi:site-specific integrase [Candidatus Nitrosotenuis cloacae]|uniref:site-specific integrase n=1 Tax=Candidatus Nitrosotenuis cloacae TaxID=1603555 RepID=UPI0022829C2E|nr:site-specific integrase [Candidatus Nitrosotenuis cloacae]
MLNLDQIQEMQDPYNIMIESLGSKDNKRKYPKLLGRFLKLIPPAIYSDNGIPCPNNDDLKSMISSFVRLASKDQVLVKNIIASFIKEEKALVESGCLNPNTVPNHIKPIHALLDAAGIAIHWKSLSKQYPRPRISEDRAYTKEELQRMIEASANITDKLIIEMFSSGGFRLEAWNYFIWKDVQFFQNDDGSYRGAALLVYRGDPESYWTFITPEACRTLSTYKDLWKSQHGRYPSPDDPILKSPKYENIRRLNAFGVKRRLDRAAKRIGLRQPLLEGRRRHEIPLDHGFRKYFNTMMRRAKVNYLDKEDMMGHSVGLEKHYERYEEADFERFPEYHKAIPYLTISDIEMTIPQSTYDKDYLMGKYIK